MGYEEPSDSHISEEGDTMTDGWNVDWEQKESVEDNDWDIEWTIVEEE